MEVDEVIALGGKLYCDIVKEVFIGKLIRTPLSGCKGNGFMMQKMNDAIMSGKPIE